MAYVIAQPCSGIKDGACVAVCPVDCIHSDESVEMYYINPTECIDCGACEWACPVEAIYPEETVPDEWTHFVGLNAQFFVE